MDRAPALKALEFPTAMVLPVPFPATPQGIETENNKRRLIFSLASE